MKVYEFIKDKGYDYPERVKDYKGKECWHVARQRDFMTYDGYPDFIFIIDGEVSYPSSIDEADEIMWMNLENNGQTP